MAAEYKPADLSKLKTYSIGKRAHKFDVDRLAKCPPKGTKFATWLKSMPPFLGAESLAAVVRAIVAARKADRPAVFAMGAHLVKVGCSPIICDLIDRGIVTAIAMNGATAIHDLEVATAGETSEEVADTIRDGSFGMIEETPAAFAEAVNRYGSPEGGLGAALGDYLLKAKPRYAKYSILRAARKAGIPATVHVAIGTDTIHVHQNVAESDLVRLSAVDFRLICSVTADLGPKRRKDASGVWCNIGSAVVLPEVFLKAVAVARNLGANLDDITTANFDMIRHYRPAQNVIGRPVKRGMGHQITGHHEIMLPLLRQMLVEAM